MSTDSLRHGFGRNTNGSDTKSRKRNIHPLCKKMKTKAKPPKNPKNTKYCCFDGLLKGPFICGVKF